MPEKHRRLSRAQDGILRCRLKAAFRSQPERRLQAAGRALEEIRRAPASAGDGF
jgi:hypothetical protein